MAGIGPGVERHRLKKLPPDEATLPQLEAAKADRGVQRVVVAFEAGRDVFWLVRWLRAHDVEAHVTGFLSFRLYQGEQAMAHAICAA